MVTGMCLPVLASTRSAGSACAGTGDALGDDAATDVGAPTGDADEGPASGGGPGGDNLAMSDGSSNPLSRRIEARTDTRSCEEAAKTWCNSSLEIVPFL